MAANESSEATASGRIRLIQAVQTLLGFFVLVVLIVESILCVVVFELDGADRTFVLRFMIALIFALVLIASGIAIWKPGALTGKERQPKDKKYSLLIGPPENLRTLDITLINWDNNACFLVYGDWKEKISLVRSLVGPAYRVNIPLKVLEKVQDGAIALDLKDKKGNRWEVTNFYLYENLRPLSLIESKAKIIQDYGEENQ